MMKTSLKTSGYHNFVSKVLVVHSTTTFPLVNPSFASQIMSRLFSHSTHSQSTLSAENLDSLADWLEVGT
jgi:hypothetical protein